MSILDNKYMMIGAAVAGLGLAYMIYRGAEKVVDVAGDAVQAINPMNNDNIINQGAESLYRSVTGSKGTIGGDIYDVTHDGSLNPTSDNNVIYRNVTDWIGGDLGGKIYDWTH